MSGEIIYEDDWELPLHKQLKEKRKKDRLRRLKKQREEMVKKQEEKMKEIAKKQAEKFLEDIFEENKEIFNKDDMDDGNTIVI